MNSARELNAGVNLSLFVCIVYILIRIGSELVWHSTKPAGIGYALKWFLILVFCVGVFSTMRIDNTISAIQLSIYHSVFQNVVTIGLFMAAFAMMSSELICQLLASFHRNSAVTPSGKQE